MPDRLTQSTGGKWTRRDKLLVSAIALAAAIGVMLKALGAPWIASGVLPATVVAVGATLRMFVLRRLTALEHEQEGTTLDRRVRVPIAPVADVDPTQIGVDPASQKILPGEKVPEYVPRDIDGALQSALEAGLHGRDSWLVVISGPSKVGKSRALFQALLCCADNVEIRLVAPSDAESLRSLLTPGQRPEASSGHLALWLDDLEPFLNDGITWQLLNEWHAAMGGIVVGTYGGKGSSLVSGHTGADLTTTAGIALSHAAEIRLPATEPSELVGLFQALTPNDRESIEEHGLAAFLVAGPNLLRDLTTHSHETGGPRSPEGAALVYAAVDWARTGRTDGIDGETLKEIWPEYLRAQDVTASFESALAWACEPIAGTIALLQRSGEERYRAYDYVVRIVGSELGDPPRDKAWAVAIATSNPTQALGVGTEAYQHKRLDDADKALRVACEATDDETAALAHYNLGVVLGDKDDLVGAQIAYRKAISAEHPDHSAIAANNLGVLLKQQGDVPAATAMFQLAIEASHLEHSPRAMFNLGLLQLEQGDRDEAKKTYRATIDAARPEQSAMAAHNLALMYATEGDLEAARGVYLEAVAFGHPETMARSLVNLGSVQEQLGDLDAAEATYQRAMDSGHSQHSAAAASNLGVILKRQGKIVEAFAAYAYAIDSEHPEHAPTAHFNLGILLLERKDVKGATEAFTSAIRSGRADIARRAQAALEALDDQTG